MAENQHYTIGALAEAADTTPRTIRYYTAEGLLPPPDTRGRYALYSDDHLLRLRLIARLKEAYLPLHEIRARIAPLSTEQVQQLLAEQRGDAAAAPSSAADYIAALLPEPRDAAPPAPGPSMRLREEPQPYNPAPLPTSSADLRPAPKQSLLSRLVPQHVQHSMHEQQGTATGESWRRVTLAPGVELHVREPRAADVQERIEQLIATARKIFE
jgi:DNA-binding transcriptional MerR regulator